MCSGQVVLAYLPHDGARFANKIIPVIEEDRRRYPHMAVSSGPEILIQVLPAIAEHFHWVDQITFEEIESYVRRIPDRRPAGSHSGLPALRAQLSELAAASDESNVRACIEFLRIGASWASDWPQHSAALVSEQSLARNLSTPEEDAAWSYL